MNLYVFERDGKPTDDFIQEVNEWVNLHKIGNLLSAAIALYVLFNDDKVDNISFRLCGLEIFNAYVKDQKAMCIKIENHDHNNTTILAKKLTNRVYVAYNQRK